MPRAFGTHEKRAARATSDYGEPGVKPPASRLGVYGEKKIVEPAEKSLAFRDLKSAINDLKKGTEDTCEN